MVLAGDLALPGRKYGRVVPVRLSIEASQVLRNGQNGKEYRSEALRRLLYQALSSQPKSPDES